MKRSLPFLLLAATFQAAGSCEEPKNQEEANACYTSASSSIDQSLARHIEEYSAQLNASQLSQLRASQVAWESYRAAQCAFEASGAKNSSAYQEVHARCSILMTQARVQLISRLQYCVAGPVPCPAPWQ